MSSILIKDTTREERAAIVAKALADFESGCDGAPAGLERMYDEYIEGRMELREVNMAFNSGYISGKDGPTRSGCGYY
ncbi:MAG: purine biosynthesis protein PurH [Clostridia bacterium]|nr:purine biosynthesis protein PurH [Clostridia bacterium]